MFRCPLSTPKTNTREPKAELGNGLSQTVSKLGFDLPVLVLPTAPSQEKYRTETLEVAKLSVGLPNP